MTAGFAAPVVFSLAIVILSAQRPGYDHARHAISALGELGAPQAVLFNALGFVPTGVLFVAFALGLRRSLGPHVSWAGPALVGVAGLGYIGAGIFSCDPGCPRGVGSLSNLMHGVFSVSAFAAHALAPLVVARALSVGRWQGYRRFSATVGVVAVVVLLLGPAFLAWLGLWQRVFLGLAYLWIEVTAFQLWRMPSSATLAAA